MFSRREFLKNTLKGAAGLALPLTALELITPEMILALKQDSAKTRWVFLVDTYKCVGCGLCVKACKTENEIPYDANATRTWGERYVFTKDGRLYADSSKGARDGFTTQDRPRPRQLQGHKKEEINKAFCPEACNPVREPSMRAGLSCGRHIPDR